MNRLLRPGEAAEILAIGKTKLYELIAKGELNATHIGRSLRISPDALDQFISQNTGTTEAVAS